MKPYLTVLIDTFNHENFIEKAIKSVLSQDVEHSDIEIIVVDDGSTDRTPEIIQKYQNQLRYIRKENAGQASAFNLGISEARGEIIAFLDGDDWWTPNKLRRVVECFKQDLELGAVGHGIIEVYEGSHTRRVYTNEPVRLNFANHQNITKFLKLRSNLGTSRLTVRKNFLEQILPFPEDLVVEADEYMFTLLPALSSVLVLNECLTYYRLHANNLYQFQDYDPIKIKRKAYVHQTLAEVLPEELRKAGLNEYAITLLNADSHVIAERHKLEFEGGWPWQTFKIENFAKKILIRENKDFRSVILHQAVLLLALLLPASWFYRLRNFYSKKVVKQAQFQLYRDILL